MAPTSFLDLPCEIRLKIYHLVYESHAVPNRRIAPYIFLPTYVARAVVDDEGDGEQGGGPSRRLLSSQRRCCYVPASVLRTCRQVYHEARALPFHANEFHFVNWFVRGLPAAVAFAEGLRPWQRAEWRYARLEVYAEDICQSAEWTRLCGLWTGLRGLRLKVVGGPGGITCGGISQGLGRLGELRQLEVELQCLDDRLTDREKVRWCAALQALLRKKKQQQQVVVTCIQQAP